jgi:hypothetical protein
MTETISTLSLPDLKAVATYQSDNSVILSESVWFTTQNMTITAQDAEAFYVWLKNNRQKMGLPL